MREIGVPQLNGRYERALDRLATLVGMVALITIPVLAALFTEGIGTRALLTAWRIGFLASWTIAFIGMLHCTLSVLRIRTRIERLAGNVRPRHARTVL